MLGAVLTAQSISASYSIALHSWYVTDILYHVDGPREYFQIMALFRKNLLKIYSIIQNYGEATVTLYTCIDCILFTVTCLHRKSLLLQNHTDNITLLYHTYGIFVNCKVNLKLNLKNILAGEAHEKSASYGNITDPAQLWLDTSFKGIVSRELTHQFPGGHT